MKQQQHCQMGSDKSFKVDVDNSHNMVEIAGVLRYNVTWLRVSFKTQAYFWKQKYFSQPLEASVEVLTGS